MSKPRVLVISPYMFAAPVSGGRILMYNHVRFLSRFYEVEILTPDAEKYAPAEGLRQFGKVHYIDLPCHRCKSRPESLSYMMRNYSRAIFARYPVGNLYEFYEHLDVQKLIKDDFDVIQLNHSWFYHPVFKQRRGKLLLIQHNYEYEYWQAMTWGLLYQRKYFRGLCYLLGSSKIFRQEQESIHEADLILALSERERQIFQEMYGLTDRCHVVNPGIDMAPYQGLQGSDEHADSRGSLNLVYVGSLHAPQHAEGVISFIKNVYPHLKKKLPLSCRLCLVGADPVDAIQQLARVDPSITLTGFIDDVKPWIQRADIYIVPLTHGSGIRFKIMEAMAMGKPIVSTKKGAEGLDIDQTGVIVVDEIQDFVSAICTVGLDRNARLQMGKANAAYAHTHFNSEQIFQDKILPIYKTLV